MKVPIFCKEKNCNGCEHLTFGDYYNQYECDCGRIIGEKETDFGEPYKEAMEQDKTTSQMDLGTT